VALSSSGAQVRRTGVAEGENVCLGIPGRIVELVNGVEQRAIIEVDGGLRREISLAVIGTEAPDGANVGDWVLIHVGFAMARLDEDEAAETLKTLKLFGDAWGDELEQFAGDNTGP